VGRPDRVIHAALACSTNGRLLNGRDGAIHNPFDGICCWQFESVNDCVDLKRLLLSLGRDIIKFLG